MSKLHEVFVKFFPNKDIREQQDEAFTFLAENITKKHTIAEAPTGSGKSLIGMTYGLSFDEKFFVTTPQKLLQKQYVETIDESIIGSFYGRSNYTCVFGGEDDDLNCENGKTPGVKCPGCPYEKARTEALAKKAAILNTSLQFANTFTKPFHARRILVIDEAHSLERVLCDYDLFSITKRRCFDLKIKFPKIKDGKLDQFVDFLERHYVPAIQLQYDQYKDRNIDLIDYVYDCVQDNEEPLLDVAQKKILAHADKLKSHITRTQESIENAEENPTDFVLCSGFDVLDMKYRKAHINFEKYIDSQYDHIIYMSATFGSLKGFAKDLGIKEPAIIQLPPFFKNEGGSFKFIPSARNTAKITDDEFAELLISMNEIVKYHGDDKGLIHCVNYKQKDFIVDMLESEDIKVFTHVNSKDKQQALDDFMGWKGGGVFVSPSSTEGLDLPDDLCRFIIFTKVPWLSLGDQWVKERMKDGNWYLRQAVIATIQACGRGIRHENDWCDVYLLDASFDRIIPEMGKWYVDQFKKGAL